MEDDYPSSLHIDLKRDLEHHARQSDDANPQDGLPLFEKYQFLSPRKSHHTQEQIDWRLICFTAIFMGLTVSIVLLLILSVGLRAISGLEVSYMAFSKEMGPAGAEE